LRASYAWLTRHHKIYLVILMKYGMSLNIDEIAQVVDAEEADPDY
jgi:hypothetical protein